MVEQPTTPLSIVDNVERHRFEGYLGVELVGVIEYIPLSGKVIATHTEVEPNHEGEGIASRLVTAMMDQLRAEQRKVQPQCAYVRSWLQRHPDYEDVVDQTTPR